MNLIPLQPFAVLLLRAGLLSSLLAQAAAAQRPGVLLDTVRITVSSRTAGPDPSALRSATVITRAELERGPARTIAEALARAPGVEIHARSPAQVDVAMRGSSTSQVLVLVDGVRVGDLQSNHFNLDLTVPLDLVERIEVLRGPASALYGADAAGGVINIVTGGGAAQASLRGSVGSFGSLHAAGAWTGSAAGTAVQLGAEQDESDGHRAGTDFRIRTVSAGLGRRALGGRIDVRAGHGDRAFGAADFYAPFPSYERTQTSTGLLRYQAGIGSRWHVTTSGSFRRHSDDFILVRSDPARYRNQHLTHQSTLEATAHVSVSPRLRLAAGAEGFDGQLWSARLGDRRESRGAVFAEATQELSPVVINAGTRVDWSSRNRTFVSPSVAATIPVGTALQLRASGGAGVRAPTWTERYYRDPANEGNPELRAEEFWNAEVGVRRLRTGRWSAELAGFARHASDLIDWARPAGAPAGTTWLTTNVAAARYRGVEADLRIDDALGISWTFRGSAMRFDADGAAGYVGKYALRPVTRSAGVLATVPAWRGTVAVDAAYARRAGAGEQVQVGSRLRMPWRAFAILLDLRNLTDADFLDSSGKPVAGRAAHLGLEWRHGRE